MTHPPLDRKGLAITVGTFLIWGVVPLYWHLLKAVPSFHIIAHRIVWSAVLVLGFDFMLRTLRRGDSAAEKNYLRKQLFVALVPALLFAAMGVLELPAFHGGSARG